jgi:integrase
MMRQIAGAFAEYEKARLVSKLRAARERKRKIAGKCEGRKSWAEINPILVQEATGARVNEITQARHCDVSPYKDGCTTIWVLRITPEAGTVKRDEYRDVPLHPHLIEMGFLDYWQTRKGKPLFYNQASNRNRSEANPYFKKIGERLGEWVRKQVKVTDERIQPNHGWRHRFKSVGRGVSMDPDVLDLIQGHVPRREAQGYGDTWPSVAYREICKIPRYEIESSPSRADKTVAPIRTGGAIKAETKRPLLSGL